jgi:glycerol-3-phosphate acyltransferase PlsY
MILAPVSLAIAGLVFLVVVWLTRYVSLGSIVTATLIPILISLRHYFQPREDFLPLFTSAFVIALLVIFAHRANIGRLIRGTESKFR